MSCVGTCCQDFTLSREMVRGIRAAPEEWEDGEFILDMLVPLRGPCGLHFTCRHHDPDTLLCRVYSERPQMCRRFPEPGYVCDDCDRGTS